MENQRSFSELWDKFEEVYQRLTLGRRDMKAFHELVTLRSHIDDRYFKELESGLKKVPACVVNSTTSGAFMDCKESTAQLARQHQQLATSFRDIAVELEKMIKDLKNTKTRLQDNHARLYKEREAKKAAHLKAKVIYEESVKKTENATISLSAAKTQCQQDKAIKKLETALVDAAKDLEKNHKAYIKTVSECQQMQAKFEQEVSSMLSQFEELENRRLAVFEEQVGRFVSAQDLVRKFSEVQFTFLSKAHQSIDTKSDVLHFIVDNFSSRLPELHVEYRPKTSELIPHYADPAALEESNNHMVAQRQIHEHLLRNAGISTLEALRQTYAANSTAEVSVTQNQKPAPMLANALYDFVGQEEGDLDFKVGDVITLTLCDPEEEWWQGTLNGRSGNFPRSYVERTNQNNSAAPMMASVSAVPAAAVPEPVMEMNNNPPIVKKVIAQFDFTGEAADELSFKTGDILSVFCEIDGWYDGLNFLGRRGIFPANYVADHA